MKKIFGAVIKFFLHTIVFLYPSKNKSFVLRTFTESFQNHRVFGQPNYFEFDRLIIKNLIAQVKQECEFLLNYEEAYQIYEAVSRTAKIDGDIAEVGLYQGGSSKIICKAKGDKCLHLFDTFEGLKDVNTIDATFKQGQYSCSLESVKNYLKEFNNLYFYKGFFPDTAGPIVDKKFSFVSIDVDTYNSTKNCIEFFYPRLNRGGILMSHDYFHVHGVRKAFDEFFADKPEVVLQLLGSQCLVVKL